jgi:hypothetical protein
MTVPKKGSKKSFPILKKNFKNHANVVESLNNYILNLNSRDQLNVIIHQKEEEIKKENKEIKKLKKEKKIEDKIYYFFRNKSPTYINIFQNLIRKMDYHTQEKHKLFFNKILSY